MVCDAPLLRGCADCGALDKGSARAGAPTAAHCYVSYVGEKLMQGRMHNAMAMCGAVPSISCIHLLVGRNSHQKELHTQAPSSIASGFCAFADFADSAQLVCMMHPRLVQLEP